MSRPSAKWRPLIALALLFPCTPALADGQGAQHFTCNGGTTFAVTLSDQIADVRFSPTEHYRLRTKPFSLGQRFVSRGATLIIDGQFAAFVTSGRMDLEGCSLIDRRRGSVAMGDTGR